MLVLITKWPYMSKIKVETPPKDGSYK